MSIKATATDTIKIVLLIVLFWAIPGSALAHHPGALGSVTHLGFQQISVVVSAALLDGMNPTALGILLLLVWKSVEEKKRPLKVGGAYVAGLISTYVIAGFILRNVYIAVGPSAPVLIFQTILAFLLFISGFHEVRDAIKPKRHGKFSIPEKLERVLNKLFGIISAGGAFPLGLIIGFVELFATGAIYLAFIQAVTFDPLAKISVVITLIAIYLFAFALPMLAVLVYEPLIEFLFGSKQNTKAGRIAKGIVGLLFIGASVLIAANTVVTLPSL